MDPIYIALITVGLLIIAILSGMYIGVALATLSALGLWWITGNLMIAIKLLGTTSYRALMEYIFGVVPLFVLMGLLANLSGASKELYDSATVFFGRVRGGIGIATVMANAVFAAITGVSIASAAIFSKIALPQMRRLGYDHKFSLGIVSGSSVLGMLIPPSILFIVYGVVTEQSIGNLFIAGIVPGILLSIILSLGIYLHALFKPGIVGGEKHRPVPQVVTVTTQLRIIFKPWLMIVLICTVLVGIYRGFFTPTEAGAIGSFGALLLVIIKRRLTFKDIWETLLQTGYTTASIFFLFISAQMYSRMLTISGLPAEASTFVGGLDLPPIVIISLFLVIFIILGAILDSVSIILITIPLMVQVVEAFNYDLIWFGVISVVAIEMGILTPPFGMVVYAMKSTLGDEVRLEDIFVGSFPFLIMILVTLIILVAFPQLSTWLVSTM